jgi:hypothetical protein
MTHQNQLKSNIDTRPYIRVFVHQKRLKSGSYSRFIEY